MVVLCGGALLLGAAASLAIPFPPFATALLAAIGIGAGWAMIQGAGPGQALLSALGILVSTQVGYGLGLVGAAAAEGFRPSARRPSAPKQITPALPAPPVGEKR